MGPWPCSMGLGVWRATTQMAGCSSPRARHAAGRTRPLDRAPARSLILGQPCATQLRRKAETTRREEPDRSCATYTGQVNLLSTEKRKLASDAAHDARRAGKARLMRRAEV